MRITRITLVEKSSGSSAKRGGFVRGPAALGVTSPKETNERHASSSQPTARRGTLGLQMGSRVGEGNPPRQHGTLKERLLLLAQNALTSGSKKGKEEGGPREKQQTRGCGRVGGVEEGESLLSPLNVSSRRETRRSRQVKPNEK